MIPAKFQDFYGDVTRWFLGTVKSVDDPLELGRLQVRIYGIHGDDNEQIPDADLPWAQVIVPITQGGHNGIGNNLGIQVGARVCGMFLDGQHSQDPIIFGSVPKIEEITEFEKEDEVIGLMMYLGDPLELNEYLFAKNRSKCLEMKQIAEENSFAYYECARVNAVLKGNKILSIIEELEVIE